MGKTIDRQLATLPAAVQNNSMPYASLLPDGESQAGMQESRVIV